MKNETTVAAATSPKTEAVASEPVIHDLFSREIRPIRNWNEWLERWQAAITIEEMIGLIHYGFKVSLGKSGYSEKEYKEIDRLEFYLKIADGWFSRFVLEKPDEGGVHYYFGFDERDSRVHKSPSELRQELAAKAFDVLCLNFFKPEFHQDPIRDQGDYKRFFWEHDIVTSRFLPVIMKFFQTETSKFGSRIIVRNLTYHQHDDRQSHNEKQAITFLLNLVKFLWNWTEKEVQSWENEEKKTGTKKRNKAMRALIESAKPWSIEVLNCLDQLDLLCQVPQFNHECMTKLKEIALRNKLDKHDHPVSKDRSVTSLDEARFAGSKAAWFIHRFEFMKDEEERLRAILEAERIAEEAQERLQKLTKKK